MTDSVSAAAPAAIPTAQAPAAPQPQGKPEETTGTTASAAPAATPPLAQGEADTSGTIGAGQGAGPAQGTPTEEQGKNLYMMA